MARALGRVLSQTSAEVHLFVRNETRRAALAKELPGVHIDDDLAATCDGAETIFFAVPADQLAEAADRYGPYARGDHIVMTACRGVGPDFALPHALIRSKTCVRKIGVIGGPIHARELASGRPINTIVASRYGEVIDAARALTKGSPVTVHSTDDIVGVQVAGAIANVASIAAGMAEAIDLSSTARGLLIAHGLVDAKRLGTALGANERTFFGLAGIGELIPRQVTSMDRHQALGRKLASGTSLETALGELDGPVEGVDTAAFAVEMGTQSKIPIPFVDAVQAAITGRLPAQEALEAVLQRSLNLS